MTTTQTNRTYNIAVIPGDGIGKEVVPEGLRVLEAAAKNFGFELRLKEFDFANCDYYAVHGRMMPEDWKEQLGQQDAIFFGAVGWPAKVPDDISLQESLIMFRRGFDQYANVRPVRLMPGIEPRIKDAGNIDLVVVRENTEGEYGKNGEIRNEGTDEEYCIQVSTFSRKGVDRILRYAFDLASTPERRGYLTSATKSNGIAVSMTYWNSRVEKMARQYPSIKWDKYHIDNLAMQFVERLADFDVVVGSNLFGDILSELAPALAGTIGIAPSGNINPERIYPSLFEPVHGSAPDIAGDGVANPVAQIWSGAMMLKHFGEDEAAAAIIKSIEGVMEEPRLRTRDIKGGTADTVTCGRAIALRLG